MRKIFKNQPPASFVTYLGKKNPQDPNYKPSFEGMDSKVKEDLKIYLLNEQGWLCGYCQQKINDINKMKIEHHCEQSICNGKDGTVDKTLDYKNLLAVCLGKGSGELHCDSKKGTPRVQYRLPMNISPWNSANMDTIAYSNTGLIKSSNPIYEEEINEILNLNVKYIKDNRSKKFSLIYNNAKHINPRIQKEKMRRILIDDLEFGDNKFSNSFPGMSEYMLKKFCR